MLTTMNATSHFLSPSPCPSPARGEGSEARINGLPGHSVAVVGAGRSGVAAARLLLAVGADVSLIDRKPEPEWSTTVSDLQTAGVRLFGGERFDKGLESVDLVVLSPGVPPALKALEAVRRRRVPIVGEVELASWAFSVPVIGVTGTNGKSTVVSLIGKIFQECGYTPFVGGNLGTPLAEAALTVYQRERAGGDGPVPFHVIVAELSSFQLETIDQFHPDVAVLLNVTPDHLDRYSSFTEYANAKAKIFQNQTSEDVAVLNADDPQCRSVGQSLRGRLMEFSRTREVPHGAWLNGDGIVTRWQGQQTNVMLRDEIPLLGDHNVSNVLAAVAVGTVQGCSPKGISRAVRSFRGLEHVMEVVRERRGVIFINDSKGTNVDATLNAVSSLRRPFVILLGGQDKGRSDFRCLKAALKPNVTHCILFGETAEAIAEAIAGAGAMSRVASLDEGVKLAAEIAKPGDVVLFSPACASFDMFHDYRDRGRQFRDLVNALVE